MPITSSTYSNFSAAIQRSAPPSYLNLYWKNFLLYDSQADALYEKLNSEKKEIIARAANQAINKMNGMLTNDMYNDFSYGHLDKNDIGILDFALDPQLQDSVELSQKTDTLESGELSSAIQKLRRSIKKKAEFNKSLEELINSFNSSSLKDEIEDWVIENLDEARTWSTNSRYISSMIKYFNSLPQGTAIKHSSWQTNSGFKDLDVKTKEWYVKLYALAEEGVKLDASSRSSIIAYLRDIDTHIFNNIQGAIHEGSLHVAELQANELVFAKVNKVGTYANSHKVITSGSHNISVSIDYSEDASILENLKSIQNEIEEAKNAFSFSEGSGNIVTYMDVNQKTDEMFVSSVGEIDGGVSSKSTSVAGYGGKKTFKMHLQSSTPLYSLLTRDLGFSGDDIHRLVEVGTAWDNPHAETLWEDIKEIIKIEGVYAALLGSNQSVYSTFLKVNNDFIPMYNVVKSIANVLSGNKSGQLLTSVGMTGIQDVFSQLGGLNSEYYQNPNAFSGGVIQAAITRSKKVYAQAASIMYNKKVDIWLNGFNLAVLASNSLFK